ncbi:GlcNAc-transferase family protein [Tatumella sp. UBA2305]|uniref:GlcNAc-transferase family protein n=1 Tax=Tatumella sp. UBA2305 TaxID=1947647 RepID=UPI0025F67133|nr:GlcNAc-transferase family protein [Tatumella sp. UBA2305]
MHTPSRIFVSIASYRDTELIPTLMDLIRQAADPQALHIAVCWQDDASPGIFSLAGFRPCPAGITTGENMLSFTYGGASIRLLPCHYFSARGVGWARHRCESLYAGEEYFLQIDAHSRFICGWDRQMIRLLEQLSQQSRLPVLSAYPPAYQPENDEVSARGTTVSRLIFREFSASGLPETSSFPFSAEHPVAGSYLAGGFIFSYGSFVRDVPNDPDIFFSGEEIAMAVRAFTRGYDIYHPHKILLWHYYQRQDSPKVWQDHTDEACRRGDISVSWWQRDQLSKQRVLALLGLTSDTDITPDYGPGTLRTLREFEYRSGVDFRNRQTLPEVTAENPRAFFATPPESDAAWAEQFCCEYQQQLTVKTTDLHSAEQEYQYFLLAVFDAKNQLLFKNELSPSLLPLLPDNPPAQLNIAFRGKSGHPPDTIRLCGWQPLAGWGPVTEFRW